MNNFRDVTTRFSLSGHFADVAPEAEFLAWKNVVGVLDLAFEPDDDELEPTPVEIEAALTRYNIDYLAIPMWDGSNNDDLAEIYARGREVISAWEAQHPDGRILVKCFMGRSRSASMLISYLCATEDLRYIEAFELVNETGEIGLSTAFEDHLERRYPGRHHDIERMNAISSVYTRTKKADVTDVARRNAVWS